MGKIVVLDENTSNRIAAGEVIERPASVVKELAENSIDAGASVIDIEIKSGGITYIRITDNGTGIESDDALLAFERHATSKIKKADDLDTVATMGFRGEALASIAAVSEVELTTRTEDAAAGTRINLRGGVLKYSGSAGCPQGTSIIVRDLFYNTPARYKFLKKDSAETGYISDAIIKAALGKPNISFRLTVNGAVTISTPGNGDLRSTIYSLFGKPVNENVIQLDYESKGVFITGYAGKADIARSNRSHQYFFVNSRPVRNKVLAAAVDEAYRTVLMKNKYAFTVLLLGMNPMSVDVNVHPAKAEVKFSNDGDVFEAVYGAIGKAVLTNKEIITIDNYGSLKVSESVEAEEILYNTSSSSSSSSSSSLSADEPDTKGEKITEPESYSASILVKFSGMKIIGQAFNTYILLEYKDELYLVDQHAAHERLIYEKIKNRFMSGEVEAQMLITPVTVQLTSREAVFVSDKFDVLGRAGFLAESFGGSSIILRSVPALIADMNPDDSFKSALDMLDDAENVRSAGKSNVTATAGTIDLSGNIDNLLFSIACKAAIKAGMPAHEAEIKALLKDLDEYEGILTCPHGRPLILKTDILSFEKLFKRVV